NGIYPESWCGRGNVFVALRRYEEALSAYDRALACKPGFAEAWLGRGKVFAELGRHDEALSAYDKAIAFKPELADAWCNRGDACAALRRHEEAFAAYDKALSLKPDLSGAAGERLHCKMYVCDWSNFDAESGRLIQSVKHHKDATGPFAFLSIASSAEDQ